MLDFQFYTVLKEYQNSILREEERIIQTGENIQITEFSKGGCTVTARREQQEDGIAGEACFVFSKETKHEMAACIEMEIADWEKDNYVLFPAAAYQGNRFHCEKLPYPPFLRVPADQALSCPVTVTDVPRLSDTALQSEIQLLSGDMSVPLIGIFFPKKGQGLCLLTKHQTEFGYTGLCLREDLSKHKAVLRIGAPGVRERYKYTFSNNTDGSRDTGRLVQTGDQVTISYRCYRFSATTLAQFYERFFEIRQAMERGTLENTIPFSMAYQAITEKYQRENYEEKDGYYKVGVNPQIIYQNFQAGWIGGGMNFYPFMITGNKEMKERCIRSLLFIFTKLQHENGWISPIYANGRLYGDDFSNPEQNQILLIRKNSDLLYFAIKELTILREEGFSRLSCLERCIQKLCDAFVRLFETYGQLGQFINIETEEIITGNTACGGITPAALAAAWDFFQDKRYLAAAQKLAMHYYTEYTAKGITNGGPGEIAQCPDSESAFGLLESYVALYEVTGAPHWRSKAEEAAWQAASWVMGYDFAFPQNSTDAKMDMRTMGTVFANAQNKHAAPGICTLSGNSLFKLYRFTGDIRYLELLQQIAHNLPQFVSTKERPIPTLTGEILPEGWANERVQTSDWEGPDAVGEILYGSNWPEVSMLLTYIEIPGIYVDLNKRLAVPLDHVTCRLDERNASEFRLQIHNPTDFAARVTLFVEEGQKWKRCYFSQMKVISIGPRETVTQTLFR